MIEFIIGTVVIGGAVSLYVRHTNEKKRQLLISQRKETINPIIPKVTECLKQLTTFLNQEKYLAGFDEFQFRNQSNIDNLYREVSALDYQDLPDYNYEIDLLKSFQDSYSIFNRSVTDANKKHIAKELQAHDIMLSNVEGNSLDFQQRNAIIIEEDNQLVIAGAGSGKTTTIAGKVKYLTQRLSIKPENILLISFTRKSADEMKERIESKMDISISVNTFHKIGLDIIATTTNEKPSIYDSTNKSHLERIVSFIDNAKEDSNYFSELLDFFTYYLKPYKDISEFSTDSEHNNYLNEQKLEGYKIIKKKTSNGGFVKYRERFKSQEEVLIANFLFRNGINYEYEEKYKYKTASKQFGQYKPDFYLPDYDIYIEHFGIDRNGTVPNWFKGKDGKSATQVYNEGIEWKRSEHLSKGTTLVETYSWQQKEGVLLKSLGDSLASLNVEFNPLSNEDLWAYIGENAPRDVDGFTQLVNTFLVLLKSNNETISKLLSRAESEKNERASLFLKLFDPIFNQYQSYLNETGEIDFSDMINIATSLVSNGSYTSNYEYIIVDEFQDISNSRYQLIKSLLDQRPQTKLFCVGDDWQSIYRFTGSDIGIFTQFDSYFKTSSLSDYNRKSVSSYIEYTYRFDNKLIDLSSNFILKNPNQLNKELKSNKQSNDKPYTVFTYSDPERKSKNLPKALAQALEDISVKSDNQPVTVLLLGRYDFERKNFNKSEIISENFNRSLSQFKYKSDDYPSLDISFLTAHRSKGLQADYVIITNCNAGTYGFPSEISDDPLLNFLLSKADQFPNGEERRLFYVAMTRAKKHVYFLTSNEYPSKFISEIESNEPVTKLKCEWCDNGKLVERSGPYGYFYSCNNNHYCNFTRKIEPNDFKNVGDELYDSDLYDEALEQYSKYVSLVNDNARIYYKMGRCYEGISNSTSAINYYTKALNLDDSILYAYYWRASSNYDVENYKIAIEDWLYFRNSKGNVNAVNYWLAKAYHKINNYGATIECLNIELSLSDPQSDAPLFKKTILKKLTSLFKLKEVAIKSTKSSILKEYIAIAISEGLNIKFNYYKSPQFDGGLKSIRTITPQGFKIVGQHDSECVFGYCFMREEERTFNMSRMSELIINPSTVEFWSE